MPQQALKSLSTLVSTPEHRNFLLSHDPQSTLSLLTSPLLLTNSTSTDTVTTQHDRSSNLLNSEKRVTTCFIPAFHIDATTLGLAITSTDTKSDYPLLTPPRILTVSRFSRSADNLVVINDEFITLTSLHSTRRKTSTVLTLSKPAQSFDILQHVTAVSKAEFGRSCPCNQPTCRCLPTTGIPQHALDFSKEEVNTALYTGAYHGAMVLQYIYETVQHRHANLRIQEVCKPLSGGEKLVQEAVMQVLSRTVRPPKNIITNFTRGETEDLLERLVGTEESVETVTNGSGRRERNRFAAARSNRKRQFRNRWLRVGIVVYRLRCERLKEVEKTLRREQFWLLERCRRELGGVDGVLRQAEG